MIVGKPVPDGQEKSGHEIEGAGAGLVLHFLHLGLPERREFRLAGLFPHRLEEQILTHPLGEGRPEEFVTANDLAIVIGQRIGAAPDRGFAGLAIDDWARVLAKDPQCGRERERLVAFLGFEAEDLGLGATGVVSPDDGAIEDRDALGVDALDAQIERASFARRFDAGFDQAEIFVEDCVLKRDTQGENPIKPA
jgi:hypothetical protein